jgi:thiol-disulfide isomerase/thioredoxin
MSLSKDGEKNEYKLKYSIMNSIKKTIRRNLAFSCCILLSTIYSFSQDSICISGQLQNNTKFAKIVVQQFGIGSTAIAAIPIDKETGNFKISAPIDIQAGVYRFQYSQSTGDYVDVILNGKEREVYFTIDVNKEVNKRFPLFTQSLENSTWHAFDQQRKAMNLELEVLDGFLSMYPNKQDPFYQNALKERGVKIKKYQAYRANFIKTTPHFFAKQMAAYTNNYFSNPIEDWRLQEYYKFENFWQGKPTLDEALLNTPLYSEAVLAYIKYYMNPDIGFSEEEMTSGFKKCVDTIIKQFEGNEKTKEFAIKYLQLGFKELGNENLLQYIDQNYAAAAQCTTEDTELQKRLKSYEALKIGNPAPEIVLSDYDGKTKTLQDYPQEEVVVVFWSSWCPHCMGEMPKLQEWAKTNPNTLVLAISLDEDYAAFQEATKKFPNMLHYCDLQKWKGTIVSDYFVAATPTFFKLDKERKIVGKYSEFDKLINK